MPNNIWMQGVIIAVATVLFLISAWIGLSKGMQYLSNLNMILAALLCLAVLILGPTLLILNMIPSAAGDYFNTLIFNSLDPAPLNEQKHEWMQEWTIYYWGWWMSWSPFVGIFIARVSRGRTIREFILAVLFVPTVVSFIWFSSFGLTGIDTGQSVPQIFDMPPETQLFGIFNEMPWGIVFSIIALVLILSFFVTSADAATFVLGMQTAFGTLHPKNYVKIIWGISLSTIAFVLLLSGGETGLEALQSAAIISALPFSLVVILMAIAFFKDADKERKYLGYALTPNKKRMKEYKEQTKDEENDTSQE